MEMERDENGRFTKGHSSYNKGRGWSNEERLCKCGATFKPRKKYQKSCSQRCAMLGTQRRKGKPFSETAKEVLSQKAKNQWKDGRVSREHLFKKGHIPKHTGKERPETSGERHWNWRDGVTDKNEKIRKSLTYKLWRKAIFKRDDYTCQQCGLRGGTLQADHIRAFSKHPKLRFELSNGRTLCKPCHIKTDNYGTKATF
jgi:5-methylcytosine-specific restriction endonuclease McrA